MTDDRARQLLALLAEYAEDNGPGITETVTDLADDLAMSLDVTSDEDDANRVTVARAWNDDAHQVDSHRTPADQLDAAGAPMDAHEIAAAEDRAAAQAEARVTAAYHRGMEDAYRRTAAILRRRPISTDARAAEADRDDAADLDGLAADHRRMAGEAARRAGEEGGTPAT